MNNTPYSAEEIDAIARYLRDGDSSAEIAKKTGRSRGAITAIVHRNARLKAIGFAASRTPGMNFRQTTAKIAKAASRRAVAVAKPPVPAPTRKPVEVAPLVVGDWVSVDKSAYDATALRIPLSDLSSDQCRWPINNPGMNDREEHLFCGHPRHHTSDSYCRHHARRSAGKVDFVLRKETDDEHAESDWNAESAAA